MDRSPSPGRRLAVAAPAVATFAAAILLATAAGAATLTPTRAGLLRQAQSARDHDFTHLRNAQEVHELVRLGLLVPLRGNGDYQVDDDVRYAVARPEVKLFVERLAQQYRAACGERLVVTSLTRPKDAQPRNSHPLSVHPTGMALDLRVSARRQCRAWLEKVLLGLEARGVLEAARERRPPHYHVVVFPRPYASYVAARGVEVPEGTTLVAGATAEPQRYRVRSGDNLWTIARTHDTTVDALRELNGLASTRLQPGQVLTLPAR